MDTREGSAHSQRVKELVDAARSNANIDKVWPALLALIDEPLNSFLKSRGAADVDQRRDAIVNTYDRLRRRLENPKGEELVAPWGWLVTVARRCYIDVRIKHARDAVSHGDTLDGESSHATAGTDARIVEVRTADRAAWLAELEVVLRESVTEDEWLLVSEYYGAKASTDGRVALAIQIGVSRDSLRQQIARLKRRLRVARAAFELRRPPPDDAWVSDETD